MANKKNTSAAASASTSSKTTKVRKAALSFNDVKLSGLICERGRKITDGGTALFTLAHNMGPVMKDGKKVGDRTMFVNVVMFPKNGSKDVAIPTELIEKGHSVVAKGYLRPSNITRSYTGKDGQEKTFAPFELVALELLDNPAPAQA